MYTLFESNIIITLVHIHIHSTVQHTQLCHSDQSPEQYLTKCMFTDGLLHQGCTYHISYMNVYTCVCVCVCVCVCLCEASNKHVHKWKYTDAGYPSGKLLGKVELLLNNAP